MTRRCSVRAHAREIYRDFVSQETPTPVENDLTARARALYEETAVPVREIAAIAGVTERTIYKYAAKQSWQKRYRRPDCAPERGAGARFIRRADKDKPIAQGLKATDPAGRSRAAAGCGEAQRLSRAAQRQAQQAQRTEACIRAIEATNSALQELREHCEARQKKPENDGRPPTTSSAC